MIKERLEIDNNRRLLNGRLMKLKDMLPLVEQLIQFRISIGEILASHAAVYKKAA